MKKGIAKIIEQSDKDSLLIDYLNTTDLFVQATNMIFKYYKNCIGTNQDEKEILNEIKAYEPKYLIFDKNGDPLLHKAEVILFMNTHYHY